MIAGEEPAAIGWPAAQADVSAERTARLGAALSYMARDLAAARREIALLRRENATLRRDAERGRDGVE